MYKLYKLEQREQGENFLRNRFIFICGGEIYFKYEIRIKTGNTNVDIL